MPLSAALNHKIDIGIRLRQIEPLGSHGDYCNNGIGRAILRETLSCLQQLGAERIYVDTDHYRNEAFHLYESVGFRVISEVLVYHKDYNDPSE